MITNLGLPHTLDSRMAKSWSIKNWSSRKRRRKGAHGTVTLGLGYHADHLLEINDPILYLKLAFSHKLELNTTWHQTLFAQDFRTYVPCGWKGDDSPEGVSAPGREITHRKPPPPPPPPPLKGRKSKCVMFWVIFEIREQDTSSCMAYSCLWILPKWKPEKQML